MQRVVMFTEGLTVSVDVHGAGVPFAVVVCVRLVWVAIVRTVVTTVTHVVSVVIVLPGVVDKWTIVLFQKRDEKRKIRPGAQVWLPTFLKIRV